MRVLFLNDLSDPRIGSSVRLMYQHAAWLRAQGHETSAVCAVQDPALAGETEIEGLRVLRLHSDYDVRWRAWVSLDNPRVRSALQRVLDAFRPDIVHAHLIHTHLSYEALAAARRARAGVVFTAHDVMTFCYQKLTCFHGGEEHGGKLRDYTAHWQKCIPCQRLRYRPGRNGAIRRRLSRDVHRFTAVSEELSLALRANGIRVDRVVPNAIAVTERLPDAAAVAAFRARHGLEGKRVLAIAGRLHEQKGVGQLFRALARVAERVSDVRLLVMGHRRVFDLEFAESAERLGVARLVVPTGWLDGAELACAYSAADVFVTPSICFDTFGMVNLEAMEHARPVVATCFGGSPEVVVDRVTGRIVNPFDIERLAGSLIELLEDREQSLRLGAAGRLRLMERFGIERLGSDFAQEYELALARARS
ncbi:MAG: glycosyltransferase family 4 protein [Planctomycetes bacterium]|nr:glycosyltransferase family 4 protein [Planctomycetota bacterium]